MVDPKKLLEKIPRFDKDRPFRYLGRRLVQAMVESATANLVLGQRTAPGRFLVVRLVAGDDEKEYWEQQFAESRGAFARELQREAEVREIKLRTAVEVDLIVVSDQEAARGEAERVLSAVLDAGEAPAALARLREDRELLLPRRVRSLLLETTPPEAQAYLDDQPVGVTPCRVDDIPEGEHRVAFSRPGFLLHEATYRVEPGAPGQRLRFHAALTPEPAMGVMEVCTFPPGARVTLGHETRISPCRWRVPAGTVQLRVELADFAPQELSVELPQTPEHRPFRVLARLEYAGADRDEVVGRLIVYKPGTVAVNRPQESSENRISSFFKELDDDPHGGWDLPPPKRESVAPEILGERPLRRGVVLIGREAASTDLQPDVKLFDPENSVTRGCHAWLWVYADRSTGATYNTFLVGNNSPAGIRVDGQLVMETRRLSDESVLEVGNFPMRIVKTTAQPKVEFGF